MNLRLCLKTNDLLDRDINLVCNRTYGALKELQHSLYIRHQLNSLIPVYASLLTYTFRRAIWNPHFLYLAEGLLLYDGRPQVPMFLFNSYPCGQHLYDTVEYSNNTIFSTSFD